MGEILWYSGDYIVCLKFENTSPQVLIDEISQFLPGGMKMFGIVMYLPRQLLKQVVERSCYGEQDERSDDPRRV